MVRFSDDGDVLKSVDSGITDLIETIESWSILCKDKSSIHQFRALVCRVYSYCLTSVGICCTGAATIMASLDTTAIDSDRSMTIYSASLSGIGTAVYAIMNIVDPTGLRERHLNACRDYDLLGREISVWIQTEKRQTDFDTWRLDAIRFQRRIDNIQAVAPAL